MRIIISIALIISLSSCMGLKEKIILPSDYVVLKDSDYDDYTVSVNLGGGNYVDVITFSVTEVGFNNDYIVVKQIPVESPQLTGPQERFFIIPLKNKIHQSKELNKIGPLSRFEFFQNLDKIKGLDKIKLKSVEEWE